MERRFLKIIIFTGLLITSCQQIPINESNKKFVGDNIDKQNLEIDKKKQEKIISYHSDIWSYILTNSSYTSDGLDEQTLMYMNCLLYTSPSPRDVCSSRMPSSA